MATMMHPITGDIIDCDVEKRLDDMGLDGGRSRSTDLRAAVKRYYMDLIQEDMERSEGMTPDASLDGNELAVIGFVAGYEACLKAHKLP